MREYWWTVTQCRLILRGWLGKDIQEPKKGDVIVILFPPSAAFGVAAVRWSDVVSDTRQRLWHCELAVDSLTIAPCKACVVFNMANGAESFSGETEFKRLT